MIVVEGHEALSVPRPRECLLPGADRTPERGECLAGGERSLPGAASPAERQFPPYSRLSDKKNGRPRRLRDSLPPFCECLARGRKAVTARTAKVPPAHDAAPRRGTTGDSSIFPRRPETRSPRREPPRQCPTRRWCACARSMGGACRPTRPFGGQGCRGSLPSQRSAGGGSDDGQLEAAFRIWEEVGVGSGAAVWRPRYVWLRRPHGASTPAATHTLSHALVHTITSPITCGPHLVRRVRRRQHRGGAHRRDRLRRPVHRHGVPRRGRPRGDRFARSGGRRFTVHPRGCAGDRG